jgi:hypothetical protein
MQPEPKWSQQTFDAAKGKLVIYARALLAAGRFPAAFQVLDAWYLIPTTYPN